MPRPTGQLIGDSPLIPFPMLGVRIGLIPPRRIEGGLLHHGAERGGNEDHDHGQSSHLDTNHLCRGEIELSTLETNADLAALLLCRG